MIRTTVTTFKRYAKSWRGSRLHKESHVEQVVRRTWWFLWFIPVYSKDTVVANNL